jgi:hypothetical protein
VDTAVPVGDQPVDQGSGVVTEDSMLATREQSGGFGSQGSWSGVTDRVDAAVLAVKVTSGDTAVDRPVRHPGGEQLLPGDAASLKVGNRGDTVIAGA